MKIIMNMIMTPILMKKYFVKRTMQNVANIMKNLQTPITKKNQEIIITNPPMKTIPPMDTKNLSTLKTPFYFLD